MKLPTGIPTTPRTCAPIRIPATIWPPTRLPHKAPDCTPNFRDKPPLDPKSTNPDTTTGAGIKEGTLAQDTLGKIKDKATIKGSIRGRAVILGKGKEVTLGKGQEVILGKAVILVKAVILKASIQDNRDSILKGNILKDSILGIIPVVGTSRIGTGTVGLPPQPTLCTMP